jgi:DNA primase
VDVPRIPETTIEQIREQNDIVEVISEYIPLKRSGSNHKALCPFHNEKTPSFNVNADRQIYHCFGCGAGGNVFTFLMEYEKISFVEAATRLAKRAGIELRLQSPRTSDKVDKIFRANDFASDYYAGSLKTAEASRAREFLKSRGINSESTKTFSIGYAPPGWDNLIKSWSSSGGKVFDLANAGLAVRAKSGKWYDAFRDRLVFPIKSVGGSVLGFGARTLDGEGPKYINTPENDVYKKKNILYGLNLSRTAIQRNEEAILVEGYTDVIAFHQLGLQNVVASSGTAMTGEQARAIKRYADGVVLVFDGDEAGIAAAKRAVSVTVSEGLRTRVVTLPPGEDPADFASKHSAEELEEVLASAPDFTEFLVMLGGAPSTPEDRERKAVSCLEVISMVDDPVRRTISLQALSELVSVEVGALKSKLRSIGGKQRRSETISEAKPRAVPAIERQYISFLLSCPEKIDEAKGLVDPDDLCDAASAIVKKIYGAGSGKDVSLAARLLDEFESDRSLMGLITELAWEEITGERRDEALLDFSAAIRKRAAKREAKELTRKIKEEKNPEEVLKLMARKQELEKTIRLDAERI